MTIEFDGNDKSYLSWLLANPKGYVINRRRGKSDTYAVLHRATCRMIRAYTEMARSGGFTERKYIKACSPNIEPLKSYVRKMGRPDSSFSGKCKLCNP